MPAIGKDQALKADDLPIEKVPVPEWAPAGDPHPDEWYVLVKTLTGAQRDEFESSQVEMDRKGRPKKNTENLRARLVVLCAVDESGAPLFSKYDIPDLGRKSSKALDRIYEKAAEMNGFDEDALEKAREDFDKGPSSGSITD